MAHKTHHVANYKKKVVKDFKELIKKYSIIAAINMENMPTAQLQKMRKQLRGKVVLSMTKRRIMKIAIDESKEQKKGIEELNKYLKGMPALMFTNENPFKLYKILQKSKTNAPAKPGQIAPRDIMIQAGPTPFAPGPVISELSMIGLKTGVDAGKVTIRDDKVVVKEGEVINDKVASIMLRLGITPMEIGLDLVAAYENGTIFTKDVLSVDESEYMRKLVEAETYAFNLGVEIKYPAQKILEYLIGKAFNESKALALEQNIMCDLVAQELLAKAEREMLSLKQTANIPDVEKKEQPKLEEKTKEEIKKEEHKPEQKKEPTTEEKVHKIVEQTAKHEAGNEPSANDLIKESGSSNKKESKNIKKKDETRAVAEEIVKKIQRGEKIN